MGPADVSLVVEGQLYLPSARRLPSGGRDAARHLQRLLEARGEPPLEQPAARALLEACCRADDGDGGAQVTDQLFILLRHSLRGIVYLHNRLCLRCPYNALLSQTC